MRSSHDCCASARNQLHRSHSSRPRQGPRHLPGRRRLAARRHRSHLRVRLRARLGHSRQGQGPHAAVGVLVRAHGRPRAASRDRHRRRRISRRRCSKYAAQLRGRSMLCRRTRPVPIECVARGYLSGSGWKEYQQTGKVCGVQLPAGLRESDRLPEPIFTPATKEESGHDINISEDEAATIIGRELTDAAASSSRSRSSAAAASTPSRRGSSSPTRSSSSAWSATATPRPTSSSSTKC